MKFVPHMLVALALLQGSNSFAKKRTPPPPGPGNCYYSDTCTGSIKAQFVSASYCLQIGGNSWRSNAPKVCYKMEPLFAPASFSIRQ